MTCDEHMKSVIQWYMRLVLLSHSMWWRQPSSPVTMLLFLCSCHCFALSCILEAVILCGRSLRGGHCWWRTLTTLAATKEGGTGGFHLRWAVPKEAEDQQCLPGAAKGLRVLRITSSERQTGHGLGLDWGIQSFHTIQVWTYWPCIITSDKNMAAQTVVVASANKNHPVQREICIYSHMQPLRTST